MTTTERTIEQSFVAWANKQPGVVCIKGWAEVYKGIPDRLHCVYGIFVAIEFKRPGCLPTPIQCQWMDRLKAAGAIVGIAHTKWEAISICYEALNKSKKAGFAPKDADFLTACKKREGA